MARTTLIKWRADAVQAVAFVTPGTSQSDALGIWSALFPSEGPESFQRHSGAPNGLSTASGSDGSALLAVTSQIGRIDVQHQGRPSPEADAPPVLIDLEDAVAKAAEQLKQLLGLASIFRVGIFTSLSIDAPNGFSQIISDVSGGVAFPESAVDCIYQHNVRRKLAARDIEINRLRTWSSGEQSLLMFNVGPGGAQGPGGAPLTVKSIPIISYNIDVNTATTPVIKLSEDDFGLIDEIRDEVLQLVQHG